MDRVAIPSGPVDRRDLERAVNVLRRGGVVAYATDTLYALAVDPRSDDAIDRLFTVKSRDAGVAVPLIAADIEQARQAADLGERELRLARAFWPGPLSFVAPAQPVIARRALGGWTTVAIRVPAHDVARALASAFGFCITATSANLSGRPAAASPDEVATSLSGRIALLLDSGRAPGGPPSTIVDLQSGTPALVRAGAIAWERVLESLE